MELTKCTAVVTGGASGLGLACVQRLVQAGARVALLDRDGRSAQKIADESGGDVTSIALDVSSHESVDRAFAVIEDLFGTVDVCVNCAGVGTSGKVLGRDGRALPLAEFREAVDVNLVGLFDVLRHCAELMARNEPGDDGERGVIINVSSVAAWQGQRGHVAYAASKAGVIGLMLPAARDLAEYGIRVVTVAPGIFLTGMHASLPEKVTSRMEGLTLYPHRAGDPEEFAALVSHVVANRYLNATTVSLDAGVRLQ